ncbi:uncharacterized protein LOC109824038 isoform X2 [Asparagus officinalis]|nr:uncharacterized protein LOC109824038 isoform X2 [Asparagus officinalis]
MEKSNFKIITDEELEVAKSGQYLLNFPVKVDESKLDKDVFPRFFRDHPHENLPAFSDKFIMFRRGIGIDHTTNIFFKEKINTIIFRIWMGFLTVTFLKRLFFKKKPKGCKIADEASSVEDEDLHVERIRIENMRLSMKNLFGKVTLQEPTFERIIILYRHSANRKIPRRAIFIKHFKNIPMADMELVLPEKINPSLTPMDWIKFLITAVFGLVTLISSISILKVDIWVVAPILVAIVGYALKVYFSFQQKIIAYQNLITRSMYDKQLDSGRGTLLHLCDDVIQQEVKEVIVSFFVLMKQGNATIQELDLRCEELIKQKFGDQCNFEVLDAVQKLEKLGIVSLDSTGRISCVPLSEANEIIGTTTEEVVIRAKLGATAEAVDGYLLRHATPAALPVMEVTFERFRRGVAKAATRKTT